MSNETPVIQADLRQRTGSRFAQRLRTQGRLPAVIYGHGADPVSISVDHKEVVRHIRDGAHLMDISIDGAGTETCLVKDLQFGWLGDNVIHVDFARVNLDEEVHVKVHIEWIGTPANAKAAGTVVNTATELEVLCAVKNIPHELKFDLSKMEGTSMTIAELTLPEGVRAYNDDETVVAQIEFVGEIATGEEAAVDVDSAEPEVISETKPENNTEE